jgi:PAS domain S-box-containing protein
MTRGTKNPRRRLRGPKPAVGRPLPLRTARRAKGTGEEDLREELRRANDRLRDAQRIGGVGSWEWIPDTGFAVWSDEQYRLLGLAPGTVAPGPDSFLASVHPDDRALIESAITETLRTGSPPSLSCRVVRPDGEVRHLRLSGRMAEPAGSSRRFIGMVQDVTEWLRAEERMSVLSRALEQTADSAFITDRDGTILYVNEAFIRLTGYPRAEAIGQTPRLLKSGQEAPNFYGDFWRRITSGESWRGTFVNRRRDGSLFHEEKTVTPIRAADGRITHFVSTGRDITERRQAEEKQSRLREMVTRSAHEWRATFDAVDSPILILDRDARVRRPNQAARRLADLPYAAIMGAHVSRLGSGPLWGAIADAAASVRDGGAPVSRQVTDRAGRSTWDVSAAPLPDAGVDDGAVIVMARDVSPVVALQESLQRVETMSAMGRLVAGVAHEVRNPLFAISATLDAFDAEFEERPEYGEFSTRLRGEVKRLTHLMQDLLEYGRPTPPQRALSALGPILEHAHQACAILATESEVTVCLRLAPALPPVEVDAGRLGQVVQNLVENAVQHSPTRSEVEVSANLTDNGAVEITVADSGPGFLPADLDHLFEPFYSRRRGGTGLGLSIVQRIVMEHGGHVQAANRPQGGALVRVVLPLGDPARRP